MKIKVKKEDKDNIKVDVTLKKKEKEKIEVPKEIEKLSLNQLTDRLYQIFIKETNEDMGIQTKLSHLLAYFERNKRKGKSKGFRLPGKIKSKIKNFHKKNKIIVGYIKEGKGFELCVTQIFKGMVWLNGDWHIVPEQAILMYNGKTPLILLPEWDLQAYIPEEMYAEAVANNRLVAPQTAIIRAMKYEETKMKAAPVLGGKAIIWGLVAVAVIIYIFFGGM